MTGSYSFATIGQQTATIVVTDSAGNSQSTTSTVEVGNLDAGVQGTLTLASFTDTTSGVTASDFTVSINWGDGNTGSGTVTQSGSSFTITATPTFATDSIDQTDGVYQIALTVEYDSATYLQTTLPVEVTRPPTVLVAADLPAQSGTTFTDSVLGVFVEPDDTDATTDSAHSINWGDGASGAGTVQEIGTNTGLFQVEGSHTYSTNPTGEFSISLSQDWQTSNPANQDGNRFSNRIFGQPLVPPPLGSFGYPETAPDGLLNGHWYKVGNGPLQQWNNGQWFVSNLQPIARRPFPSCLVSKHSAPRQRSSFLLPFLGLLKYTEWRNHRRHQHPGDMARSGSSAQHHRPFRRKSRQNSI